MNKNIIRKIVHNLPYIRRLYGYIDNLNKELEILRKYENLILKDTVVKKNDYEVYFLKNKDMKNK